MRRPALVFAALTAAPSMAWAHGGALPGAPLAWTLTPWLVVLLALSLILYVAGAARLLRRSRRGRRMIIGRSALFVAGWLALAAATVSPLHEAGERSFTLHMIEHEILMLVAAPLLVLSRPLRAMVWAFPRPVRRGLGQLGRRNWLRGAWRALTQPVAATLLQAAALWLWHMPALFDLALDYEGWHVAQHLSFLLTSLLFWQAVLEPRRHGLGLAAICLFATSLVAGALGALMALSQSPWYARYAMLGLAPFGLSPVEDQQLAGLLMWIPGGVVHAGAALILIGQAVSQRDGAQRPGQSLARVRISDADRMDAGNAGQA